MATLHDALAKKLYCHVLLMLDKGSDANTMDKNGRTILMNCCSLDDQKVAGIIAARTLKCGAKRDVFDCNGRSALCHAILNHQDKICRMIMARDDFDIAHKDNDGNTALHFAVKCGNFSVTHMLVSSIKKYTLEVDVANKKGMTPLMLACANGDLYMSRYLVHEGKASLTMRDNVSFRNAREWLETALVVPEALDPFRKTIPIGIFASTRDKYEEVKERKNVTYDMHSMNNKCRRVQSAKARSGSSATDAATSQLNVTQRVKSASLPSFSVLNNNNLVNCQQQQHQRQLISTTVPFVGKSDGVRNIFVELYTLYAIQSSKAYKPPVACLPPDTKATKEQKRGKQTDDSRTSRRPSTKSRIQKVMRIKRAESIFSSLKRNRSRSEFQRKLSTVSMSGGTVPENSTLNSPHRRKSTFGASESDPGRIMEKEGTETRPSSESDQLSKTERIRAKRRGERQMSTSTIGSSD